MELISINFIKMRILRSINPNVRVRIRVQFYLPSMKQESWTVNSTEIDELRTEMPVIAAPEMEEHLTSQLLEELNDVIYVSDPKTYELLFINRTIKEDLNIIDDYIGKKCYKVLARARYAMSVLHKR